MDNNEITGERIKKRDFTGSDYIDIDFSIESQYYKRSEVTIRKFRCKIVEIDYGMD